MRRAIALALFAAVAGGEVPAAEAAARATLVERLAAFATWCAKNERFLDRDAACELILRFEPDHPEARKTLKYVRRGAEWVRLGAYSLPKNMNAKAQKAAADERAAIAKQFADAVLAALEKEGDTWSPSARKTVLEDVLVVAPDDERARARNGEVRVGDRWVRSETVDAAARRRELSKAAHDALASVPEPKRGEIGADAQLGVAWTDAMETEAWRVVSTTGTDEAKRAAVLATAAVPLFEACFGVTVEPREGQIYYMVAQVSDFQLALSNHPRAQPEFRKFAMNVGSTWLPRTNIFLARSQQSVTRLELAARQPVAALLLRTFGVTPKQGWAYEGIGLYLTELLAGTHTTYTVHPTEYARDDRREKAELFAKIQAPEADWFDMARGMVRDKKNPELAILMGKDVNDMDAADLVFSYALGAYLLEAYPAKAPELLRAIGEKKVPFVDAVPKILGIDVRTLDERLCAWLPERR